MRFKDGFKQYLAYWEGGKASGPLAFVVLAIVSGAAISQASFAFADDSSIGPLSGEIWQAISELQSKIDSLQAQKTT